MRIKEIIINCSLNMPKKIFKKNFSSQLLLRKFSCVLFKTICCSYLGYAVKIIILNVYRTNCKKMFFLRQAFQLISAK